MSKRLRCAIIGVNGRMGGRRVNALTSGAVPDAELALIIDVPESADRLKPRAAALGVDWATSPRAVVDRPDVDCVLIATHVASHHELAALHLEAGKHVHVEKPTAAHEEQCRRLVALAERYSLVLFTGFNRRHLPLARAAALVRREVVGEVLSLRAEVGHSHFVGADDARARAFLGEPGAGPLLDLGVHAIDLGLLLAGGGFDRAAGSATHNAGVLPAAVPAIETAEFVRSADGARFTVEASYARPRKFMGLSLEVNGTRGHLRLDMSADPLRTDFHALTCATFAGNRFGPAQAQELLREHGIRCKGWEEVEGSERGSFFRAVFGYDDNEAWSGDLRAFVRAVREGRAEHGRDGLEVLGLVGAARRSARAGGLPVAREAGEPVYVPG